jgi:hypothetical protein
MHPLHVAQPPKVAAELLAGFFAILYARDRRPGRRHPGPRGDRLAESWRVEMRNRPRHFVHGPARRCAQLQTTACRVLGRWPLTV